MSGVWLKGFELHVGDVIDAYRLDPGAAEHKMSLTHCIITKMTEVHNDRDRFYGHNGEMTYNPDKPREWHVTNRIEKITVTRTVAKSDSLWNGKCPRCGRGTYTGASTVEHEGGSCE